MSDHDEARFTSEEAISAVAADRANRNDSVLLAPMLDEARGHEGLDEQAPVKLDADDNLRVIAVDPSAAARYRDRFSGWRYQWICQLDWAPDSWTAPLDAMSTSTPIPATAGSR